MKKPGLFAASVAAASASISVSSPSTICNTTQQEDIKNKEQSSPQRPSSTDKFAPRFDGLRFIETLVTAHR